MNFRSGSGFNADRSLIFISMWIRIKGAKRLRIQADPNPGQTLKSQKVERSHEYIRVTGQKHTCKSTKKAGNKVYLLILFNFHVPGSGSAFPIKIWIRIQDSQIDADQCGSVSDIPYNTVQYGTGIYAHKIYLNIFLSPSSVPCRYTVGDHISWPFKRKKLFIFAKSYKSAQLMPYWYSYMYA